MKVYTYWVDCDKSGMPDYIKLCMRTWSIVAPDSSVEIINHANINNYLPKKLLTPSFYDLSLAMQSDVVSVWVLLSRGGLFMDADTIMTKNPFSMGLFPQDRSSAFGYPHRKSIHLAVMSSPYPNNPLLFQWISKISERLARLLPSPLPWNYVGNDIVNDLLKNEEYSSAAYIIDAASSGNIIELDIPQELPYLRYLNFYFTAPKISFSEIVGKTTCGLISLHNSWTPEVYRKASIADIYRSTESILLSHLLSNLCQPVN